MIAVTVAPGDTLSGIAASHDTSLSSVEAANPQIENPNLIYAGEQVIVPAGGSFSTWRPSTTPASSPSVSSSPSTSQSATSSGGGITSIPGVPSSFVSCVAFRESTNGTNQAYNGGVYGIINASGYHVNGQSLSAQKAAFKSIYDTTGPSAWSADGCPGT